MAETVGVPCAAVIPSYGMAETIAGPRAAARKRRAAIVACGDPKAPARHGHEKVFTEMDLWRGRSAA